MRIILWATVKKGNLIIRKSLDSKIYEILDGTLEQIKKSRKQIICLKGLKMTK